MASYPWKRPPLPPLLPPSLYPILGQLGTAESGVRDFDWAKSKEGIRQGYLQSFWLELFSYRIIVVDALSRGELKGGRNEEGEFIQLTN